MTAIEVDLEECFVAGGAEVALGLGVGLNKDIVVVEANHTCGSFFCAGVNVGELTLKRTLI
jgi:hypothetical protein